MIAFGTYLAWSVTLDTLTEDGDVLQRRTSYHAMVVRPGEWLDGEKN